MAPPVPPFSGRLYIKHEPLEDYEILLILLSCQRAFFMGNMDLESHGWNQAHRASLAAAFVILIGLRLPALTGPANLSQDATEYIDIARNFAAGDGLTLRIRAYFFGDGFGVPYPAESLRSPLFPLLMGGVYAAIHSGAVFQWFNFVLFLVNMGLLTGVLKGIFPPWIVILTALLAGMSEPMFLTSIFPWAEQTAFLWLLLAVLLASRELHLRWGVTGAVIEGLVCSLAALSRPEYMLVGVLFLALLLAERSSATAIGGFLAGFLLPLGIVSAVNLHFYGRTFLPGDYLFHARQYSSYFAWGSGTGSGTLSFLSGNWLWIIGRILRNFVNYLAKLVGWRDLFALAVALPLVLKHAARGYDRRKRVLALIPAAFLFAYCLVWGGIDRERYLLPVTTFWLPLCIYELVRLRRQARRIWVHRALLAVALVNLPLFAANLIRSGVVIQERRSIGERFYADANSAWSNPDVDQLIAWIRSNVDATEVLCLENPFLINYETGRNAVVLPEQISPNDFQKFLTEYRVKYWVQNVSYTKRDPGRLKELEHAVQDAGATEVVQCGTYRIWYVAKLVPGLIRVGATGRSPLRIHLLRG